MTHFKSQLKLSFSCRLFVVVRAECYFYLTASCTVSVDWGMVKHDEECMPTRTLTVPNVPTSYVEVITSKVSRSRRHHDLVKRSLCTNDHDMLGVL